VKVNLTKRVQTPEGLRYCPVVEAANGRLKPDYVAVNGVQEKHAEAVNIWSDASAANAAACRLEGTLRKPGRSSSRKRPS